MTEKYVATVMCLGDINVICLSNFLEILQCVCMKYVFCFSHFKV
jgi:hypothetical protein